MTKRSIQLHEYRQAVIGIRNVANMDKALKQRTQADVDTLVKTGEYIAKLEAERATLLDRIKSMSETITIETRHRKMVEARWEADLVLFNNYLNESLSLLKEAEMQAPNTNTLKAA